MKLLDTSVAIDALRKKPAAVDLLAGLLGREWRGASEIVRLEVLAGLRPGEEAETERLFADIGWVPVDEAIARRAGTLAREFRPGHGGIEDGDYLIAATALELDAELLTTNVRHFPMLPGLHPAY